MLYIPFKDIKEIYVIVMVKNNALFDDHVIIFTTYDKEEAQTTFENILNRLSTKDKLDLTYHLCINISNKKGEQLYNEFNEVVDAMMYGFYRDL